MMVHELLSSLWLQSDGVEADESTKDAITPGTTTTTTTITISDEEQQGEEAEAEADAVTTNTVTISSSAEAPCCEGGEEGSSSTASSSSAAAAALPFAHVATADVVKELNEFEVEATQTYQRALHTTFAGTTIPPGVESASGDEKRPSVATTATATPTPTPTPSSCIQHSTAPPPRLFSWSDISIESVLGEGAFSFVFQVQVQVQVKATTSKSSSDNNSNGNSNSNSNHETSSKKSPQQKQKQQKQQKQPSLALKCLKAKAISETHDLLYNAMDLQIEAQILSRVEHPHIIALRGVSQYTLGDSYSQADGFFILLEIMETTLLDKLSEWRHQIFTTQGDERRAQRKSLLSKDAVVRRLLTIALPVISAMDYLHSHRIVLRDLKPENIGFDAQHHEHEHEHTVKLFDFGLARTVDSVKDDEIAGSVCYMAPEVLLGQGKGTQFFKSDIYSMAMVVWELCTLDLPMARFQTMEQVQQRVAKGRWRPSVASIPSRTLRKSIIPKGWAHKPADRPTAKEMELALERVCGVADEYSDEDEENKFLDGASMSSGMGVSTHSLPSPALSATTGSSSSTTNKGKFNGRLLSRAKSFGFFQTKKK